MLKNSISQEIMREGGEKMRVYDKEVKDIIVKSKLPAADYVINPYVGCTHKCLYCYACFMQRFSNIPEDWGDYIVIKHFPDIKHKNIENLEEKTVLLSSVTDPYQPINTKYQNTAKVLRLLSNTRAKVEILTKSKDVLQDLNILKTINHITIGMSLSTLDDHISRLVEPGASASSQRISTLKQLHDEGIRCYAFISPIIPYVTDVYALIDQVSAYVDYICFENLNLQGAYKKKMYQFIEAYFPNQYDQFKELYQNKEKGKIFWDTLAFDISQYCEKKGIPYKLFFYHSKIKKKK